MTRNQKRQAEQEAADWRWLAEHAQGRRIVQWIVATSGYMGPVFSAEPLKTAYAEGRRSIAGEIYTRLTLTVQRADLAALLAEVLLPDHVRDRRDASPDRDDPDSGSG